MNANIEQAKEELKQSMCSTCDTVARMSPHVLKALALLETCKSEPAAEPGEFTALLREVVRILNGIYVPAISGDPQNHYVHKLMTGAHQACDRLDAQQKEIERLKAENEMRVTDAVRNQQEAKRACGQWSDTVDRLEHEIETLTAENMSREKRIAFLEEDRDGNQKQIDDLTAENKAQAERIEKLKRFGRHIKFPRCEWFVIGGHCTCGWEEISKEQP